MHLFHEMAMEQREVARESHEVTREAEYEAIDTQAAKIREAANFALAAGIVSGSMSIASGVGSLKGVSGRGISAVRDAAKLGSKAPTVGETGQLGQVALKLGEIGQPEHNAMLAIRDASLQGQKALVAEAHDRLAHQTELHGQGFIQQMMETIQQARDQMSQIANARRNRCGP